MKFYAGLSVTKNSCNFLCNTNLHQCCIQKNLVGCGQAENWKEKEGRFCNRNFVANHKSFFLYVWAKSLYISQKWGNHFREIKLQFKIISTEGANNPKNRISKMHSRSAQRSSQTISLITFMCFSNIHSTSFRFLFHSTPKHFKKFYLKYLITYYRTISVNIQQNLYLFWEKVTP